MLHTHSSTYRAGTLIGIQAELVAEWPRERFAYGARSEAAVYVGDLLHEEVPTLRSGELRIVAIARRPGVLSKVAIRSETAPPRIGADHIARVREQLDGERIETVAWQRSAPDYIADALGLAETPPVLLLPGLRHARVLLGEIDVRGIAGWRDLNTILASALTGWRIRLEPVATTVAWERLDSAMRERRPIAATLVGQTERGLRVEVLGLYATVSGTPTSPQSELPVRITRMDPDEGRIFATTRLGPTAQQALPII